VVERGGRAWWSNMVVDYRHRQYPRSERQSCVECDTEISGMGGNTKDLKLQRAFQSIVPQPRCQEPGGIPWWSRTARVGHRPIGIPPDLSVDCRRSRSLLSPSKSLVEVHWVTPTLFIAPASSSYRVSRLHESWPWW